MVYFRKHPIHSLCSVFIPNNLDASSTIVVYLIQVLVPLLSNDRNHEQWPQVVSQDVDRHVRSLKSNVYVVSGQAKGKTLLPLPVGTERVDQDEER